MSSAGRSPETAGMVASDAAALIRPAEELTIESLPRQLQELEDRLLHSRSINDDAEPADLEPADLQLTVLQNHDDVQLLSSDFTVSRVALGSPSPGESSLKNVAASAAPVAVDRPPMQKPVPRPRLSKMAGAAPLDNASPVPSNRADALVQPKNKDAETATDGKRARSLQSALNEPGIVPYQLQLEFAQKLGFSEGQLMAARAAIGPGTDMNELLSALIQVHSADSTKTVPGSGTADVPQLLPSSSSPGEEYADCAPFICKKASSEKLGISSDEDTNAITAAEDDDLRVIVMDGSNIAMSHGNKQVFSCRGIQIAVNWFKQRGHRRITVFVPQWRKETAYPMAPISDQHILDELEHDKVLVYTPSRRLHGRRVVCYDDRFVLQLASCEDAVVVSNDNYRDLIRENPAFRRIVEERLLMYTFVNDRFMPPDDPLGRHGPTLDQFLRRCQNRKSVNNPGLRANAQPCPYARKCTYGSKCKYAHPERSAPGAAKTDSFRTSKASPTTLRPAASSETGFLADVSGHQTDRHFGVPLRTHVTRSMSSSTDEHRLQRLGTAWLASSLDDDERTHSLPVDTAAAQHRLMAGLPNDREVLRECEAALAQASSGIHSSWHLPPARREADCATAAVLDHVGSRPHRGAAPTQHGFSWHASQDLQEDNCLSDPTEVFIASSEYGDSGAGSMQSMLRRQHSYSDPYLSGSYGDVMQHGSPYSSSSELVARTSWPYNCSVASPSQTSVPPQYYVLQPRGASSTGTYELMPPPQCQPWPYYQDSYGHAQPPVTLGGSYPVSMPAAQRLMDRNTVNYDVSIRTSAAGTDSIGPAYTSLPSSVQYASRMAEVQQSSEDYDSPVSPLGFGTQ